MTSDTLTAEAAPAPLAPLYPGVPIIGIGPLFRRNPIGTFFDATAAVGDVARVRFPVRPFMAHILRHPDHIEQVLVDNAKNYGKQTISYWRMREFLGKGLVTSEGDFWRRQRRIANPAFHRERIAQFADTMTRCTEEMIDGWGAWLQSGAPFDVAQEMMRVTLRIIGLTMLSTDVEGERATSVAKALDVIVHVTLSRVLAAFSPPLAIPTPQNVRFKRARAALDGIVNGLIAERRQSGETERGDLLSMLMTARDPQTGEGMSDLQLRDEVMTIFLAGHETTANALAWTLYALGQHPEVELRLREEIRTVVGERPVTLGDLPKLGLLERVLLESMRIHPPVWSLARSALEDDVIGGYRIPAKTWIFISPFLTHRDPRFWPEPERFDPDRFLPEVEGARPKGAYFPFALGPRKCIGEAFSMLEARLILSRILQRTELRLTEGFQAELDPTVTLRPKRGIWVSGKAMGAAEGSHSCRAS
jgi:cytochrome P450